MISKSQGRGHKWLWLLFLVPNGEVNENVLEGSGKIAGFTYYYARDACFSNRRFPVEMMHAGSIYEDQIETF